MFPIYFGRGLDKKIKKGILNKNYNMDELNQIYKMIMNDLSNAKMYFIIDVIIFSLLLIFIFFEIGDAVIGAAIPVIIILIILYYNLLIKSKRQFVKAVGKAYPEYLHLFKK